MCVAPGSHVSCAPPAPCASAARIAAGQGPVDYFHSTMAAPSATGVTVTGTKKAGVPIHVERRGNKTVTIVRNVQGDAAGLVAHLRKSMGTGGIVLQGGTAIELQGDCSKRARALLEGWGLFRGIQREQPAVKRENQPRAPRHGREKSDDHSAPTMAKTSSGVPGDGRGGGVAPGRGQASAPLHPRDSLDAFRRMLSTWPYWDRDWAKLHEHYETWLQCKAVDDGLNGDTLAATGHRQLPGRAHSSPPRGQALDTVLDALHMLSRPCAFAQRRSERRAAALERARREGAASRSRPPADTGPAERMVHHALGLRPAPVAPVRAPGPGRVAPRPPRSTPSRGPSAGRSRQRCSRLPRSAPSELVDESDLSDGGDDDWSPPPSSAHLDLGALLPPAGRVLSESEEALVAASIASRLAWHQPLSDEDQEDSGLATAIALSLETAHGQEAACEGTEPMVDDDEALSLALALSAAEAREASEPGPAPCASPTASLDGGGDGFRAWAEVALADLGDQGADVDILIDFVCGLEDPPDEAAYLRDELGLGRAIADEWEARRMRAIRA